MLDMYVYLFIYLFIYFMSIPPAPPPISGQNRLNCSDYVKAALILSIIQRWGKAQKKLSQDPENKI
jgi:hypothetical protein